MIDNMIRAEIAGYSDKNCVPNIKKGGLDNPYNIFSQIQCSDGKNNKTSSVQWCALHILAAVKAGGVR